jgi:hypothetical protein
MSSVFRPTVPADQARIVSLAGQAFGVTPEARFLDPALLDWKYWQPRPDYPGPRGYVIERDGAFTAHAGVWPVEIEGARGVHMIDWMSSPHAPGAGVSILQKLTRIFDFVIAIGGSAMTQEILPRFGFARVDEACLWARPLRPLRQILHHQTRSWKLPARYLRNSMWAHFPRRAVAEGWRAEPAADGWWGERGAAFFQYLDACPAARCLTFRITRDGAPAGCFALSLVGMQARLAGVWLEEETTAHWQSALTLAQEAALRHTDACEITARLLACRSEAAAAGMRMRGSVPVYFRAARGAGVPRSLSFQFADNDEVFLDSGGPGFLT